MDRCYGPQIEEVQMREQDAGVITTRSATFHLFNLTNKLREEMHAGYPARSSIFHFG
jgi:hypothetical protein